VFSGPESDRLAIRELIDSYSDAVIRRDAAAWAATWTEDAVWRVRGGEAVGRAAIVERWTQAMAGFDSVWFAAFAGSIAIAGDEARLVTHTLEHLVPTGGNGRLQSGIYEDRAVRTGAGWRFAERSFTPREMSL
jgi:uncharacterized protein (TIGR02246 family)